MNKITIIRNGEAAKKFDAVKTFQDYFAVEAENQKNKWLLMPQRMQNSKPFTIKKQLTLLL
jgi:peptidylprolyl isomerase